MTPKELYLSLKSVARNVKTTVRTEKWSNKSEFDTIATITDTEFFISNKQGHFMNGLICKYPTLQHDKSVICYDDRDEVRLVFPPSYIKNNGLFKIVVTNIKKTINTRKN